MARDRATGADPLARLAGPASRADTPWGVTGMPNWLDTPQGRRAWSQRAEFDCLSDEPEDEDGADRPDDYEQEGYEPEGYEQEGYEPERYEPAGIESLGDGDRSRHGDDEEPWDDEWDAPRRRFTMLPPAAIGLIVVGLVACAIAGYSLLKQNEPTAPLVAFESSAGPRAPAAASGGESASVPPPSSPRIVVSVVGLVNRPGLVELTGAARVADALKRAGGARPGADLLSLNMAQPLHDGDQILIGRGGEEATVRSAVVAAGSAPAGESPSVPGGSAPAAGTGLVDLNTATAEQLDALPGVGPVTAASILAWRQAHGRFDSVDRLAEVDGIGPGRLAKLKPLVTVG
ncbi:hypothetical protein GCM10009855_12510 [Gordonia cholesterolivorans]|uniref:Helix-hairpin-helix DNA-binding motif class 1 domain-containing protein n=1 Tax=Gordonia cholesterolivorans TaxID=559625 RepID=A0ABP5UEZ9_9ACTN